VRRTKIKRHLKTSGLFIYNPFTMCNRPQIMGKNLSRAENRWENGGERLLVRNFSAIEIIQSEKFLYILCAAMNDCVVSKVITVDLLRKNA
jgi:hypothetical protein